MMHPQQDVCNGHTRLAFPMSESIGWALQTMHTLNKQQLHTPAFYMQAVSRTHLNTRKHGTHTWASISMPSSNTLPPETRACSSLLTFQSETKSHLFCQSYGWLGAVHSDHQQMSALSCATVLDIDFVKCPTNVWWQHYNPDIFSSSSCISRVHIGTGQTVGHGEKTVASAAMLKPSGAIKLCVQQWCHKYTVCKYKYKYLGGKYKYKYSETLRVQVQVQVLAKFTSTSTSTEYQVQVRVQVLVLPSKVYSNSSKWLALLLICFIL